jgi:hypothetical protein
MRLNNFEPLKKALYLSQFDNKKSSTYLNGISLSAKLPLLSSKADA